MKLSIVIPVYNVEKYLSNCLDSILHENYTDLEVLLINNNSTDSSNDICKKYQKEFPKIVKVLDNKKPGAAATRNYGVTKASGDYIWFVDSDDEITPGSLAKITSEFSKNPDVITFGVTKKLLNGSTRELTPVLVGNDPDWRNRYVMYGFGPFQNIYKRDFWIKNMKEFPEGIIHEDMALLSAAVLYTDNIISINESLYYYFERETSVLHHKDWNPHVFDIFPALENLYRLFSEVGQIDIYYEALEYFFIWNLLLDSSADFSAHPEGKPGHKKTREMLKKYFPNWRKNQYFKKKSFKMRFRCILNYYK